jgi:hypothetical protein
MDRRMSSRPVYLRESGVANRRKEIDQVFALPVLLQLHIYCVGQ